mmetsp:Transcript_12793/g.30338  ORF Transcript_12793/g.30338 Transcript_12793/m.30338 type:complete len:200 (-) Transcript_12793:349-948(-)
MLVFWFKSVRSNRHRPVQEHPKGGGAHQAPRGVQGAQVRQGRVRRGVHHVPLRGRAPLVRPAAVRTAGPRQRHAVQHQRLLHQDGLPAAAAAKEDPRGAHGRNHHQRRLRPQPHDLCRLRGARVYVGLWRVRAARAPGPEGRDVAAGRGDLQRPPQGSGEPRHGLRLGHLLLHHQPGGLPLQLGPDEGHRRQHHVPQDV